MTKKVILIFTLLIVFTISSFAQTPDRKWAIGLHGGAQQYSGDFGNGFYKFDQAFYAFGGISIARNLGQHFDVELNASYGDIGHVESAQNNFLFTMTQFNLNAKYNFFKPESVKLRPFVFLGLGYLHLKDKRSDRVLDNFQLPDAGLGVTYSITPAISIVFKETFIFSDYDNIEFERGGLKDSYLQHSLGVVFSLGKAKDDDGDGIPNKLDKCPQQAGELKFNGCPDSDGDGIADMNDKCPNTSGLETFGGCPDSDGDGIQDSEDSCPNVKGLEKFAGCPDTDGDGIQDSEDKCPRVKGLAKFAGCPDTDGDGIQDSEDRCPRVKGVRSLRGCPDSDGDGIADKDDLCPKVAGVRSNRGCPEVKKEEKQILEKALHGIKFKSGKDIIARSSFGILDNVVAIMQNNPSYNLKIAGHTDSQGKDEMNLDLSKRRALAVKNYLINKGVSASRLSSEGYGETMPIDDNSTAAGRAQNRRVELTVVFETIK